VFERPLAWLRQLLPALKVVREVASSYEAESMLVGYELQGGE
jgi:hypothetical protein